MDLILSALAAVLPGAVVTLQISVCAWLISVVVGLLISVLRDTDRRIITLPLGAIVMILRSLPQLIVLYIVFYGLGSLHVNMDSLTAAILGLGIADAAYSAEAYRAGFLTVSRAQREAGLSLGLSKLAVMRLIVIPEAVPFLVPPLLNSFVALMKGATLASALGAPEILYGAQNYMARTGQVGWVALVVIVLYWVATIPLTHLIARLETHIRAQYTASK